MRVALDQELTRASEDPSRISPRPPHRAAEIEQRARTIDPRSQTFEGVGRGAQRARRDRRILREEAVRDLEAGPRERRPPSRQDLSVPFGLFALIVANQEPDQLEDHPGILVNGVPARDVGAMPELIETAV